MNAEDVRAEDVRAAAGALSVDEESVLSSFAPVVPGMLHQLVRDMPPMDERLYTYARFLAAHSSTPRDVAPRLLTALSPPVLRAWALALAVARVPAPARAASTPGAPAAGNPTTKGGTMGAPPGNPAHVDRIALPAAFGKYAASAAGKPVRTETETHVESATATEPAPETTAECASQEARWITVRPPTSVRASPFDASTLDGALEPPSRKRRRHPAPQSWAAARPGSHRCSCGHVVARASLPNLVTARAWADACASTQGNAGTHACATPAEVLAWAATALRRDDTAFVPLKLAYGRFVTDTNRKCDSENAFVAALCSGEKHCGLQQRADREQRACAGKGSRMSMRVIPHFAFTEDAGATARSYDSDMESIASSDTEEAQPSESAGAGSTAAGDAAGDAAGEDTAAGEDAAGTTVDEHMVTRMEASDAEEGSAKRRALQPAETTTSPSKPNITPPVFAHAVACFATPLRASAVTCDTRSVRKTHDTPSHVLATPDSREGTPGAAREAPRTYTPCAGLPPAIVASAHRGGPVLSIAQGALMHEVVMLSPAGLITRIEEDLESARVDGGMPRWFAALTELEAACAAHHRAALRNALWMRWVTGVTERRESLVGIKFLDVDVKTARTACAHVSDAAAAETGGIAAILGAVAWGVWNNGVGGAGPASHAVFAPQDVLFAMWYGTARMLAGGALRVLWVPSEELLNPRAFTCDAAEALARGASAIVSLCTALRTLQAMPAPRVSATSTKAHSVLSLLIAVRFTGGDHTFPHGRYLDFVSSDAAALEPAVAATLARLWPGAAHGRFYSNLRVCGFPPESIASMRTTTNVPFVFRVNLYVWSDGRTPAQERYGFALSPTHVLLPFFLASNMERGTPLPGDMFGTQK